MDLPPLPQRSSSPAPLPSSSKTFPPPLLPQEAQFMCLDDDTFVGRKESCPLPPPPKGRGKDAGGNISEGGDGRRGIFRLYAIHVCPSALASTNDKKFIRLVGGKKHHLEARADADVVRRGGGERALLEAASLRLASPPIAPYSHRLSRKKGEKQHNCESMALHHCT